MKVGIVGSGGREHALCAILRKSSKIIEIFCFPGNAGTSTIAQNIDLDANNFEDLKNFILKQKIDLMIIGPEKPLVEGIVDYFEKHKIKVFGPNKIAAQLEGSKIFTKKICQKYQENVNFGLCIFCPYSQFSAFFWKKCQSRTRTGMMFDAKFDI